MSAPRILVAGVGNVFLGDDGFGVEVAARRARRPLPDGVQVVDYGLRSRDLGYALADEGWAGLVLVDATRRGGAPGTLYVLEPTELSGPTLMDAHALDPSSVLALVETLGGAPPAWLRVVGCEPAVLDELWGLSEPVEAAIEPAIALVDRLVAEAQEALA